MGLRDATSISQSFWDVGRGGGAPPLWSFHWRDRSSWGDVDRPCLPAQTFRQHPWRHQLNVIPFSALSSDVLTLSNDFLLIHRVLDFPEHQSYPPSRNLRQDIRPIGKPQI